MDGAAIVAIGGVVGSLCRLLTASGLTGRAAIIAALLVTTATMGIWGYAHGDFTRTTSWDYFTAWVAVLMGAAGTFKLIDEAPAAGRATVRMVSAATGTKPK